MFNFGNKKTSVFRGSYNFNIILSPPSSEIYADYNSNDISAIRIKSSLSRYDDVIRHQQKKWKHHLFTTAPYEYFTDRKPELVQVLLFYLYVLLSQPFCPLRIQGFLFAGRDIPLHPM